MKEYLEQHEQYMAQIQERLSAAKKLRTELELELVEVPDTTCIFSVVTNYVVELGLEIRDLTEQLEREQKWANIFRPSL